MSSRLPIAVAILSIAAAQAATIQTTLSVTNGTGQLTSTSFTFAGPVTLTNIGSGTLNASFSLSGVSTSGLLGAPFTITLSTGDTLTGTAMLPATAFQGGNFNSGSGSVSITGGTGLYAGATGSFPSISGSGFRSPSGIALSFSGAGTITTATTTTPPPPPASGPTVTGVLNNYSFIPPGYPNSGIAPSSIITIFGTGMAAAQSGTVSLNSTAGLGLPLSQNGTSISVTVNGTTTTPAIYYALPTQIAAVLPHNTRAGTGTLTVTYNNAPSNAFSIQVVASALGLDTYYGTGGGLITATNASTGALFNYTSSISPGETITLWGTGLGADPDDSDTVFTSTPHAVNQSSVHILFGGVEGKVLYAGSSGYPGLDQINVTVPDPVGCNVGVIALIDSIAANFPTAPIADGGGECSDPLFGVTGSSLTAFSGAGGTSAAVFVAQTTSTDASGAQKSAAVAEADFRQYTSFSGILPSVGSCMVDEGLSAPTSTGIEMGTMSLSGPGSSGNLVEEITGLYGEPLSSAAAGGSYTFNWTGGAVVGGGSATVSLPNPFLTWTNQSASTTVTRSEGIQLAWTGGAPGSFVIISGTSSATGGKAVSFVCYAAQSALAFTVPSYITSLLPAGTGTLGIVDTTPYQSFKAPGLTFGTAWGSDGVGLSSVTYQ